MKLRTAIMHRWLLLIGTSLALKEETCSQRHAGAANGFASPRDGKTGVGFAAIIAVLVAIPSCVTLKGARGAYGQVLPEGSSQISEGSPGLSSELASDIDQLLAALGGETESHWLARKDLFEMLHEADSEELKQYILERLLRISLDGPKRLPVIECRLNVPGANFQEYATSGLTVVNANLAGADFSGSSLVNVQMKGARLDGSRFNEVNGGHLNLAKSTLRGASMEGAAIHHANLSSCDLSGATLRGGRLVRSDLSGAIFRGAVLDQIRISDSDCSNAVFDGAILQGVIFSDVDLPNASFVGADVRGSNFRAARGLRPEQFALALYSTSTIPPGDAKDWWERAK